MHLIKSFNLVHGHSKCPVLIHIHRAINGSHLFVLCGIV